MSIITGDVKLLKQRTCEIGVKKWDYSIYRIYLVGLYEYFSRNQTMIKPFRSNRLLQGLVVWLVVLWLITATNPLYPKDWLLENLLVFLLLQIPKPWLMV